MPNPMDLAALAYLRDIMRSRTPAYIPDSSVNSVADPPANDLLAEIDRLLSRSLPASPAYNRQRLFALDIILKEKAWKLEDDLAPKILADIVEEIHDRRPYIEKQISPEIVDDLYSRLTLYDKITGGNPNEFPYTEVLGHRRDERTIKEHDDGVSYGTVKHRPEKKANLRAINRILDTIIPSGEYFNRPRQFIVDTVIKKGYYVNQWLRNETIIAEKGLEPGAPKFMKNSFFYPKKAIMIELEREIGSWERKIESHTGLTAAAIVRLGELLRAHLEATSAEIPTAKRRRGTDGSAIVAEPQRIPDDIKDRIRRIAPIESGTNDVAKTMATRVIDSLHAVVTPRRGNFETRERLLGSVMKIYRQWTEPGSINIDEDSTPIIVDTTHQNAVKDKAPELAVLAQNMRDYRAAWSGDLQVLPLAVEIGPVSGPSRNVAPKPGKAAGDKLGKKFERGQQKLSFGTKPSENREDPGPRTSRTGQTSSLEESDRGLEERVRTRSGSR